ncbi:MAG TPA: nicotinamide riboside transporter PnuC [Thermoanaerobaculia bacterium]
MTVLSIWLATREHLWYWPTGIVSTILYTYTYWQFRLYAEAGLQLVWLGLIAYGWYEWLHGGKDQGELPVTKTPRRAWPLIVIVGVVASAAITAIQMRYTNNPAPLLDSSIAAWSIVAQVMIARKWLENWILWTIVNCVAIPLYLSRGYYPTAVVYTLLLVLGIRGYFTWRKSLVSA